MAHNPPNGNQPQQKVSAKRVKREPKSQQTDPQPQASQSARQTKAFRLKGGMAKTKTAGARRHRPLFSEQYWDNQPKIHLTHSALMEFRRREAKIRWGGDRDKTPDLITTCKSVKEFAKRGGPDLTHLCDYQHPDTRDRRFRIPRLSMPAIYDMNLEGYLEHNGVEKRLGMALEPSNVAELRRIMREDRSDLSDFNVGARLSLAHLCTQYKTDSNALRGIYLNLFGRIGLRTDNYRGTPLEGTITATKKHFYNLDPIVPHMISAKPDLVDGADRRDLMTEEERVEEEKKEEEKAKAKEKKKEKGKGKEKEKEEKEDGDEGQRKTGIGQGKEKKEEKGKGKEGKDGEVAKGDEGKKPTILTLLDRYITPYHLLDDVQVDEEDPNKMILPNFFLYNILKHDDQLAGGRAALHSGALGARALHELEHYGKDHVEFDGQAHTFAAVLATTHMTIYAFHPIQPTKEGRKIDYQMTAIKAFRFDDDTLDEDALTERVRDGIKALRNLREEAHRYRQKLIDDLFGVGSDDDDEDDEDDEEEEEEDDDENEEDQEDDDDNEDDDNDGGDDNNDNSNDADDEGDENDVDEEDNSQENSNEDGNYDDIDNDQDKENGDDDDDDDGRNNSSKEENSDNTDKKQTQNGSATKRKREPNPGVGFLESFIKRMRRS